MTIEPLYLPVPNFWDEQNHKGWKYCPAREHVVYMEYGQSKDYVRISGPIDPVDVIVHHMKSAPWRYDALKFNQPSKTFPQAA